MSRLVLTTGDLDGVGLEVTLKALKKISRTQSRRLDLFIHKSQLQLAPIKKLISQLNVSVIDEGSIAEAGRRGLTFVVSASSPAFWVETAAQHCLDGHYAGLVTGPLSKPEIARVGLKDIGHTDILKRVAKTDELHMGFAGEKFNVVLATGHIPLKKVPATLSSERLNRCLNLSLQFCKSLGSRGQMRILGLNPHAGDEGLIGLEEKWLARFIKQARAKYKSTSIVGPIAPDSAFLPQHLKKNPCFIALYHDQGLIPFKALHGMNGAHVTLGLPFVRTSVDHGTAKDIFGKNMADPSSMIYAINLAFKMI